jgi:hypothetical protein
MIIHTVTFRRLDDLENLSPRCMPRRIATSFTVAFPYRRDAPPVWWLLDHAFAFHSQATISLTTLPLTSVSRNCRP